MKRGQLEASASVNSRLAALLDRLARPIELASQSKKLTGPPVIKNLDVFVSQQVIQALAEHVHSAEIEAELIALRELFREDQSRLSSSKHNLRLSHARQILSRLRGLLKASVPQNPDGKEGQTSLSESVPSIIEKVDSYALPLIAERQERIPSPSIREAPYVRSDRENPPGTILEKPLWELEIQFAKGVGPKRVPLFEKLGMTTIEEALWYVPWRYEDRSQIISIRDLREGASATIQGMVHSSQLRRTRRRGMTILSLIVGDNTGMVEVVYFNQPYLESTLSKGTTVILSGIVGRSPSGRSRWQMKSPQYEVWDEEDGELLHGGRIVPIYHETKGLTSRHLRRVIKGLLDQYLSNLEEPLPFGIRTKHDLPIIYEAIKEIHFPSSSCRLESLNTWSSPAHRRLAFEECLLLQLALALRQRINQQAVSGIQFQEAGALQHRLQDSLPYRLTPAQVRVIGEIRRDMMQPYPMNRLIQGDVGSGKTVVAMHAMAMACGSGYQAVLMAPTEILAEQHYLSMRTMLEALGLKPVLIKSGLSGKERETALRHVKAGDAHVVIGTHALIQHDVEFAKLGLVVVDEQHKFGVLQRAALRSKGLNPDVLVMTATPIPRTLAMTAYGELQVSVIDQLPPGRKPVKTILVRRSERQKAYQLLRNQIEAGRQAYIVYPLVEESEKMDLDAAIQAAERLRTTEFPEWRVGLLHGRMKSEEKAQAMAAFKERHLDILVATTVIEVGLDVPNATVMLIEHAERFGLAQLHQLRGRIGRGQEESFCLLVSPSIRASSFLSHIPMRKGLKNLSLPLEKPDHQSFDIPQTYPAQTAQQRLQAMVTCSDGFAIAEEDLRIRGPGEFLGVRQWGVPEFRVVDLIRDGIILEQAREEAFGLLDRDPELTHPNHHVLKAAMLRRWQKKFDLGTVG